MPGKPMEIVELTDQTCWENKTVVFIRIPKYCCVNKTNVFNSLYCDNRLNDSLSMIDVTER